MAFSSDTGDRMALTMVEQLVGTKYQIVGYYDMRTDNLTLNKNSSGWRKVCRPQFLPLLIIHPPSPPGQEVIWWRRGNPPQDRTIIRPEVRTVAMTLYIPMLAVSVIGIILAIILIFVNNKFNYRRIIMHSHPSCNNLILMGNILCLLATIPLGFNTKLVR